METFVDENYTYVRVCPKTRERITEEERGYSGGVCPRCGNYSGSTFTHSDVIRGRWEYRYNTFFFGLLRARENLRFIEKEQNDCDK